MYYKNLKAPKGWKTNPQSYHDYFYFETKEKSKIYKGQPKHEIFVRKHPLHDGWTAEYGQAPISMPTFLTQNEALVEAKRLMKLFSR
jgi:hypothetical protein